MTLASYSKVIVNLSKNLSFVAIFVLFANAQSGLAGGKGHKAHSHGEAKLSIVIESAQATTAAIEFESPAEGIYGFEHEAKSQKDKDRINEAVKKFEDNIGKMIQFDAKLNCKFTKVSLDPAKRDPEDKKAKHAEVHANYTVACDAPLAGTKVNFGFTSVFPRVKHVEVTGLSGDKQAKAEVKKDKGSLDL